MQRVVVIGCMGAGKSIFAERLGLLAGLRVYHLDELFWGEGREPERAQWKKLQEEIASGWSWVIEGNYGATIDIRLKRADTVIFLDFSTLTCFWGVVKRIIISRLGLERRPDIVRGCNERTDLKFLKYAWDFNKKHRKGILSGLLRHPEIATIVLRERREAEGFLKRIEHH